MSSPHYPARNPRRPKLPGIPTPSLEPANLRRFMEAVKEYIEVREDGRAGEHDRFVTFRDLADLGLSPSNLRVTGSAKPPSDGFTVQLAGGGYASISIAEFEKAIRNSNLYKSLTGAINDPTRFDHLPALVREILLSDLAAEARLRQADIQRLEKKIQDSSQSLAMSVETTTAALGTSLAAVRETTFASATETQAVAGKVTQLVARLDDVDGNGVTIEEVLYGSASLDGLMGQYTLKINAGGAVAGFGVAAENVNGALSSAFLIQANKFAIVSPTYSGGLTNSPPSNLIPFGVDSTGVYINGQVRINADGATLDSLANLGGIELTYNTQYFKYDAAGAVVNSTITLTAILASGLTGYVDWTAVSGYSGSLPAAGTSNTATLSAANMTADSAVIKITKVDGATTYEDTVTIVKLRDGSNAVSAILTNESVTVPAESDGSSPVLTNATSTMRVYVGAVDDTANWTFSTTASSGVTVNPMMFTTKDIQVTALTVDTGTVTKTASKSGFPSISKTFTVTKAKKGVAGTNGTNGDRGSLVAYTTNASLQAYTSRPSGLARWSIGAPSSGNATLADNVARDRIWVLLGNSNSAPNNAHLRIGDTVTITNNADPALATVSVTGYWGGSSWLNPGVTIDGNLLVNGTISGSKLSVTALQSFTGQFSSAASGQRIVINDGGNGKMVFYNSSSAAWLTLGTGGTSQGSVLSGNAAGSGTTYPYYFGAGGVRIATGSAAPGANALQVESYAGIALDVLNDSAAPGDDSVNLARMVTNRSSAVALLLQNTSTGAPLRLAPQAALPTDRTAGNICFYNGWLCFANGSHWFQANGTQLT